MNPTPAPSFDPWTESLDRIHEYERRLKWWTFCGLWIALGNAMMIRRGWYRRWSWKTMPLPPVAYWRRS